MLRLTRSRIFSMCLIIFVLLSFVGTASAVVETKKVCLDTIEVKCGVQKEVVEVPESCSRVGIERELEDELDNVNNGSINCSSFNERDLDRSLEPSQSEKMKGLLVSILFLLILFSPLLFSIALSIYYGEGRTEKLYLTGFSLLNPILFSSMILLLWTSYHLLLNWAFTLQRPDSLSIFLGGLFGVTLSPLIAEFAAKRIFDRTDVQSKRIILTIYLLTLVFALIWWFLLYDLKTASVVGF